MWLLACYSAGYTVHITETTRILITSSARSHVSWQRGYPLRQKIFIGPPNPLNSYAPIVVNVRLSVF